MLIYPHFFPFFLLLFSSYFLSIILFSLSCVKPTFFNFFFFYCIFLIHLNHGVQFLSLPHLLLYFLTFSNRLFFFSSSFPLPELLPCSLPSYLFKIIFFSTICPYTYLLCRLKFLPSSPLFVYFYSLN